jgi:hypothetical protein
MGRIFSLEEEVERKKEEAIDKKIQVAHDLMNDLHGICNKLDEIDLKDVPKTFRKEIARNIVEIRRRLARNRSRLR